MARWARGSLQPGDILTAYRRMPPSLEASISPTENTDELLCPVRPSTRIGTWPSARRAHESVLCHAHGACYDVAGVAQGDRPFHIVSTLILEDEVWATHCSRPSRRAAGPRQHARADHAWNPIAGHATVLLDCALAAFDVAPAGSLAASWSTGYLGRTITAVPRERLILSGGEERKRHGVELAGPIQQHRQRDEFAADPRQRSAVRV